LAGKPTSATLDGASAWIVLPFFGDPNNTAQLGAVGFWWNLAGEDRFKKTVRCTSEELMQPILRAMGQVQSKFLAQKKAAAALGKADPLLRYQRLMTAVMKAQMQYVGCNMDPHRRFDTFQPLLGEVLALTESEYGFLAEVNHSEHEPPSGCTWACINLGWNDATREWYNKGVHKGLRIAKQNSLYASVLKGELVIANDASNDPRAGGTPRGHPPLDRWFGMPFFGEDRSQPLGFIALANRPQCYDDDIARFLEPVCVCLAMMVSAARTKKKLSRTKKELRKATEFAKESSETRSRLLANVSHEFKTPINIIKGIAENLLAPDHPTQQPSMDAQLKQICSSSNSLLSLVDQLLAYSMSERKAAREPVEFDLWEAMEESLAALASEPCGTGVGLICQVDDSVPNTLVGDALLFKGLIVAVGELALKHTKRGTKDRVLVSIVIKYDHHRTVLKVCVKDMPPVGADEVASLVLDEKGASATPIDNMQLNATLSRELVKNMSQFLRVERSESEVEVAMPVGAAIFNGDVTDRTYKELADGDVVVLNETLLCFNYLDHALKHNNSRVRLHAVSSCEEARSFMQRHSVKLCFVNGDAPSSPQLSRLLEAMATARIPTIYLKSGISVGKINKLKELPASVVVLPKPVKSVKLFEAIEAALRPTDGHSPPAPVTSIPIPPPPPAPKVPMSDRYTRSVLVVDDNAMNRSLLGRILAKLNYIPSYASNGLECLQLVRSAGPFSIVLMDLMMPVMDGFEATRRIRELEARRNTLEHIPIVGLTACIVEEEWKKCAALGMDELYAKPIGLKQIAMIMAKYTSLD